jgi:hypothetical protein
MADRIRRTDYWYAHVPDTPGQAWRIVHALQEAGVNLLAFSAFPASGKGSQVDLVPEARDPFLKACKEAGLTLTGPKACFLIDGTDRTGAVASVLARLAEAKINVTALDATCAGSGRWGAIFWVKPDAVEATAKALGI